ncbi:MAG: EAL domain-containing protein [Acidobacteriota bacterium]
MPDAVARVSLSALRAAWLKLRGCLFDPNTRLPALPMVIDDVRRRLEAGETMALIYLEMANDQKFELTYGWQAYDRVLLRVAEALAASRLALFTERDALVQIGVRSDEFVLFFAVPASTEAFGEPSGASAEDTVARRMQALLADLDQRLHGDDGDETDDLPRLPTLQSAAAVIASAPTLRPERSIYQCLQRARERCRHQVQVRQTGRLAALVRMLDHGDIITRYQPIVALQTGRVYAYEALSAPPPSAADAFANPEVLFSFAEQTDRITDLERLCRRLALRRLSLINRARDAPRTKLFLNCSAPAFEDPRLVESLISDAISVGVEPGDLVLEVTERVAITEWSRFRRALDQVRAAGFRVAIDDMGSGYSSLHTVAEIEPDYLKFDLSLVLNVHRSRIKQRLLESLVDLARKIGSRAIAEGLERREEFDTVRALGIDYGQGYLFAQPAVPEQTGSIHFPPVRDADSGAADASQPS